MKKVWWTIPVAAASVAAVRKARSGRTADDRAGDRWLTVTVNRPLAEVSPDDLPEPLAAFPGKIEVRVRPAPGDRGTELAVRPVQVPTAGQTSLPARLAGEDPRQELRLALRRAKALLEAGEVLLPDAPPTTRPTPGGKLVEMVTRRAGGEGVL
ncbi:hypothetical protein [Streptomyces fumanus]|uniref:Uncharacterized protein n=1 Tax=Streptomyces fumanus TaxID=67302 RepID=A0A919AR00_9ACTN|nr:hypothetical protein [Streptomyces fumanus]GHF22669.1 hypothetical protein GCM10018772_55380 [Streptomyces fumanus]